MVDFSLRTVVAINLPVFLFFASAFTIFRHALFGRHRVFLILTALCSAPWIILLLAAAVFPGSDLAFVAGLFVLKFAPILAWPVLGLYLVGRLSGDSRKHEDLALFVSCAFVLVFGFLYKANS